MESKAIEGVIRKINEDGEVMKRFLPIFFYLFKSYIIIYISIKKMI